MRRVALAVLALVVALGAALPGRASAQAAPCTNVTLRDVYGITDAETSRAVGTVACLPAGATAFANCGFAQNWTDWPTGATPNGPPHIDVDTVWCDIPLSTPSRPADVFGGTWSFDQPADCRGMGGADVQHHTYNVCRILPPSPTD